jgi:hypothetical protein
MTVGTRCPGQTEAWWVDGQGSGTGEEEEEGCHRKEGSGLRSGAVAARAGSFSVPWHSHQRPQSLDQVGGGSWSTASTGSTPCSSHPVKAASLGEPSSH